MEFKAKNKFFNLLKQFETHYDGKLFYNGLPIEESGTIQANLKFAFDEFKEEFEKNLLEEKSMQYIGILLTSLNSIREEIKFQLDENVIAYREPLTEKEFPDEKERQDANQHMKEQYRLNQLPLLEEIVWTQLYYMKLCKDYINEQAKNIMSKIEAVPTSEPTARISIQEEVDPPANKYSIFPQLWFNCSRNELTVLFWLFKKCEFIETGRNEFVSFIQNFFVYKDTDGKYYRMNSVNTLISDFEKGAKNPNPSREKINEILENCMTALKRDIETLKSEPIGEP